MSDINEFGKVLINEVRDKVLYRFHNTIEGHMKSLPCKELFELSNSLKEEEKEVVKRYVYSMVDSMLHNTLFMFEEHQEFKLMSENKNIAEMSDGLAGELYTEDGWIEKFSEYPFLEP